MSSWRLVGWRGPLGLCLVQKKEKDSENLSTSLSLTTIPMHLA